MHEDKNHYTLQPCHITKYYMAFLLPLLIWIRGWYSFSRYSYSNHKTDDKQLALYIQRGSKYTVAVNIL